MLDLFYRLKTYIVLFFLMFCNLINRCKKNRKNVKHCTPPDAVKDLSSFILNTYKGREKRTGVPSHFRTKIQVDHDAGLDELGGLGGPLCSGALGLQVRHKTTLWPPAEGGAIFI